MSLKRHFELMATYNRWMNAKVYDAASKLDKETLHADKGAFFGSVFSTLNHLMVADTIWLKRFANHPAHFAALEPAHELPMPHALNQPLHCELPSLHKAREGMDEMIVKFVGETTDSDFEQPLSYKNTKGEPYVRQFGPLLQHFFNHQTHHRGQITTLLTQSGVDVGVTDLAALVPEWQQP
jgi:uncharacterized damage-inducible protein DinB